jgi:hypothetical protein
VRGEKGEGREKGGRRVGRGEGRRGRRKGEGRGRWEEGREGEGGGREKEGWRGRGSFIESLFSHLPGTLLHFEDHNLRNVYFLDPQWLAKLMADVIHPAAMGTAVHINNGKGGGREVAKGREGRKGMGKGREREGEGKGRGKGGGMKRDREEGEGDGKGGKEGDG